MAAPAGYIITDSGKTFRTEYGAIKNQDGSAHQDEADPITFRVENERGAALPNTGGPGSGILYFSGILLTGFACAGLTGKRRRKNAS